MMSMWTAPSDRDYYAFDSIEEYDYDPDFCLSCGAYPNQACEPWCETRMPAEVD